MAEFMRRAADAYREKHGLLTSQGIKSRRERLGMSQERFAKYLGVSVPSIKRWELGQVQDRAMNRLLLLMTDLETAEANAVEVRRRLTPEPLATEPGGETRFSSAGHMRENLRGQQPSA